MSQSQNSNLDKKGVSKPSSSRLSLGVHSMPRTSEKSFKSWFVIAGVMVVIIIALFLLLVI